MTPPCAAPLLLFSIFRNLSFLLFLLSSDWPTCPYFQPLCFHLLVWRAPDTVGQPAYVGGCARDYFKIPLMRTFFCFPTRGWQKCIHVNKASVVVCFSMIGTSLIWSDLIWFGRSWLLWEEAESVSAVIITAPSLPLLYLNLMGRNFLTLHTSKFQKIEMFS